MPIEDKEKSINSLIIAVVLMATTLSTTLLLGFGISSNGNLYILILLSALLAYKISKSGVSCLYRVNKHVATMIAYVVLWYAASKLICGSAVRYSLIQFVFYTILPIICISFAADTKLVCKYVMYLSLLTILGGSKWFGYIYSYMNQAEMGYIYPVVTMLICAIYHFRYYRKDPDTRWLVKLCYFYNAYMLVRVCMVANRGALLTVIVTVFVAMLYDFKDDDSMKRISVKQIAIWIGVIAIVYVSLSYTSELLAMLSNLFSSVFGYVPSTILKMQRYIGFGDISNGRSDIYDVVLPAIFDSPIWGHGIETIHANTNGSILYPHNFIVQFLYEGGLVFAFFPLLLAISMPVKVLAGRIKDKDQYVMAAMLTCQCYPKLLLSSDPWMSTSIWLLIMYSFMHYRKHRY